MLALQPIKHEEAEKLDKKITAKIHDLLGFPFRPNSDILMLPVKAMGFKFPSIAKINMALAVEGIARDLNHHIYSYQSMARITMADWACSINGCKSPLDDVGIRYNFTRYWSKIPGAWIVGQQGMNQVNLKLWKTDQSFITRGEISLSHLFNLMHSNSEVSALGHMWKSLWNRGVHWINQVGQWKPDNSLYIPEMPPFSTKWKANKPSADAWMKMRELVKDVKLHWCVIDNCDPSDLLETRDECQSKAKKYI